MAFGVSEFISLFRRKGSDEDALSLSFADHSDEFQDGPLTREEKFVVEAMEPRILLSADPLTGEMVSVARYFRTEVGLS